MAMFSDYSKEAEFAGVSEKDIKRLLAKLNEAGRLADHLGLELFGGDGSLAVRKYCDNNIRPVILGHTRYGNWDGGDGGERYINGLWVGEGE